MRLALALSLLAVAVGALAAPAAAEVVYGDDRIAGYRVKADGTLGGATSEFGRPGRLARTSDVTCTATWTRLGLRIGFYNLGGLDPCGQATGHFSNAVLTTRRWRTGRGLHVGDPVSRIRALYPSARLRAGGWWLVPRTPPTGAYPGLLATVRDGRVSSLVVRYPAGGD